jgi:hypothetical protein
MKEQFKEAFDLIEAIKFYSGTMPNSLREEMEIFLRKYSEQIYGIKDYLNE